MYIQLASLAGVGMMIAFNTYGQPVVYERPLEVTEVKIEASSSDTFATLPPILKKIAWCESRETHYTSEGVLTGRIDPDDIGLFQINKRYHWDAAVSMGLNIYDREDNIEYAVHLFETQGVQPWSASKNCWYEG